MKVRKKPIEVEAVQWTGNNVDAMQAFAGENFEVVDPIDRHLLEDQNATASILDRLHSTWVLVFDNDWIIKGIKGEFYPCNNDVFQETYETV